jgi:hypothetical protein
MWAGGQLSLCRRDGHISLVGDVPIMTAIMLIQVWEDFPATDNQDSTHEYSQHTLDDQYRYRTSRNSTR